MNPKQVIRIESALMDALSYLQRQNPTCRQEENEYDQLIAELRMAVGLCRTWRAVASKAGGEATQEELPGQMHIPGVSPCEPKK